MKEPRWLRVIALLPALAIASFGAVGVLCADLNLFTPAVVLVLGTAMFAGLCACVRPLWRRNDEKESVASALIGTLAVALSIAYAFWNGAHASQHVQINRDGGLYLNTGKWLATHGTLSVRPFVGAFASSHAVVQTSNGVSLAGRELEFSLSHMLPALLAVTQSVGGDHLMFLTNPIMSGMALLAFYVLALRLARNSLSALGATACLAFVMPQMSFSRDIRFAFRQRSPLGMAEVRQLTKYQELVESIYTETAYQFQTDSQSHAAQIIHRFFEAQAACISQRAKGTPELVFHNITRIAQQNPSRFFFALDYMSYDAHEVIK